MSSFVQPEKVICIHFQRIFSVVYMISLFRATAVGLTVLTCAKIQSIWQFELQDLFFGPEHNAHKWTFGRIIEHNTLTSLALVGLNYAFPIQYGGLKLCLHMQTKVKELIQHLDNLNKKECCIK